MKYAPLIIALLLAGCGWTNGEAVKEAQRVCEPHGGIKFLIGSASAEYYDVECENGVKIEGKVK